MNDDSNFSWKLQPDRHIEETLRELCSYTESARINTERRPASVFRERSRRPLPRPLRLLTQQQRLRYLMYQSGSGRRSCIGLASRSVSSCSSTCRRAVWAFLGMNERRTHARTLNRRITSTAAVSCSVPWLRTLALQALLRSIRRWRSLDRRLLSALASGAEMRSFCSIQVSR